MDSKTIVYDCPDDPRFDFRNPLNSPMTVTQKDFRMSLFVHNASKDDITVWHNNRVKPFSFNQTAKFLECVLVLSPGQNVMKVRANGKCGSKTETVIVNFTAPNTNQGSTSKKPSSPTIGNPNTSGNSSKKPSSPVLGNPNTSGSSSSGKVNTSSNSGSGKINTSTRPSSSGRISAPKPPAPTSKKPSTSKPATTAKPSVSLISPTSSSKVFGVKGASTKVRAKVTGVAGKSNIRVLVNGKPTSSFSYNGSSKIIDANISLKAGSTTKVDIIAVNSKGQARKTMNLTRK